MSNSLWPQRTAAHQIALSSTISQSLLKFMSTESVMLSNHLILCHPLLILPSVFPSIRAFSSELALCIRWPKYYSFSFRISPSNEYSWLISFRIDWFDLLAVQGTSRVFSSTTIQKHQFFSIQPSLWSSSHIHTWLLENHKEGWMLKNWCFWTVLEKTLESPLDSKETKSVNPKRNQSWI